MSANRKIVLLPGCFGLNDTTCTATLTRPWLIKIRLLNPCSYNTINLLVPSFDVIDAEVHTNDGGCLLVIHGVATHSTGEVITTLSSTPLRDMIKTLNIVSIFKESTGDALSLTTLINLDVEDEASGVGDEVADLLTVVDHGVPSAREVVLAVVAGGDFHDRFLSVRYDGSSVLHYIRRNQHYNSELGHSRGLENLLPGIQIRPEDVVRKFPLHTLNKDLDLIAPPEITNELLVLADEHGRCLIG